MYIARWVITVQVAEFAVSKFILCCVLCYRWSVIVSLFCSQWCSVMGSLSKYYYSLSRLTQVCFYLMYGGLFVFWVLLLWKLCKHVAGSGFLCSWDCVACQHFLGSLNVWYNLCLFPLFTVTRVSVLIIGALCGVTSSVCLWMFYVSLILHFSFDLFGGYLVFPCMANVYGPQMPCFIHMCWQTVV